MIGKKVKLYIATGIGNTTCLVGGGWKENNSLGREQCSSWEVQGKKCPHPGSRYDVAQCPHTVVSTLKLPVISRNMARITNLSPFPKTLPRRRLVETSGVAQVNEPPPHVKHLSVLQDASSSPVSVAIVVTEKQAGWRLVLSATDWMFASNQNSCGEALISNEVVFGEGVSGVIRSRGRSPHDWD